MQCRKGDQMAYMNQEKKAKIAAKIKPLLARYGLKGSLSVGNRSTIALTLKSGKIDFIANSNRVCGNNFYQVQRGFSPNISGYDQVNPYWFQDHYDGEAKEFLTEAFKALKSADWYDNSNSMIDYFNTAYYVDVNIGRWDKPYELVA
jgi:hypothetical protein